MIRLEGEHKAIWALVIANRSDEAIFYTGFAPNSLNAGKVASTCEKQRLAMTRNNS